jgi:hypothetical protein
MKSLFAAGVIIAAVISAMSSALGADLPDRPYVSSQRAFSHHGSTEQDRSEVRRAFLRRASGYRVWPHHSSHRASTHQSHSQRASMHLASSQRSTYRRSLHQRASSQRASTYHISSNHAVSQHASTSNVPTHHAATQSRSASVSIPEPDLLERQVAPDCEFKSTNQADSDVTLLRIMTLDYERQCYQQSESILRARMERLQDAVKKTIESLNPGSRQQNARQPTKRNL